jgi:PilZ domain
MPLFSRILQFKESQARQKEQRQERRYPPGRNFPLYATIEVAGEPRNAKVLDLSPGGAGLQVAGPSYAVGDEAKLYLLLQDTAICMEFSCRIAHLKPLPVGCRLGLHAKFANLEQEAAFLQLLQPIVLGSAMRPVPPEEVTQDDPTMHKLIFTGTTGTTLTVWRQYDATGDLASFLWQMDDYVVRGSAAVGVMQLYTRQQFEAPSRGKRTTAKGRLRGAVDAEIRQLFRWTMLNLPKEVPGDVRAFLQGFVD